MNTEPSGFSTFVGQEEIKFSLATLVAVAHKKREPMQHLLLCGQHGMGKVTLAKTIADEMGVNAKVVSGHTIEKVGELANIMINISAGDFLIIEQIEALRKQVMEVLISPIADFCLDITVGKGGSARNIKLKLPHFTLIGTTSNLPKVGERLINLMFTFNLVPYSVVEVGKIISLAAPKGLQIDADAANLLAEQSNGRPGEALRMLKKAHDYAIVYSDGQITSKIV